MVLCIAVTIASVASLTVPVAAKEPSGCLGKGGDAQKNVLRILAESANDGKSGRGKGRRTRKNCRLRAGFPARRDTARRHRAAHVRAVGLKIVLVPAIMILYIRARRTRRKLFPPARRGPRL